MVTVILAAAGSGTRMNHKEKKQFIELLGIPLLLRTMRKFEIDAVDEFVLVINEEDQYKIETLLESANLENPVKVVFGGARRQDSIYNGLKAASGDIVMIHDAARPFITTDIIKKNIESVKLGLGIITGVPCKDTIKIVRDDVVTETLNRSELVNVQTPQTFYKDELVDAYDYAHNHDLEVTDDASIFEAYNKPVSVVMGSYDNIKITTPDDLLYGEFILKKNPTH